MRPAPSLPSPVHGRTREGKYLVRAFLTNHQLRTEQAPCWHLFAADLARFNLELQVAGLARDEVKSLVPVGLAIGSIR